MASSDNPRNSILRLVVGIAAVMLILAGMHIAARMVNMVLFAGLLTLLCIPLLRWLQARGVKRGWAVMLICLLVLSVVLLFVGLIGISLAQAAVKIPTYQEQLSANSDQIAAMLTQRGIDPSAFVSTLQSAALRLFGIISGLAVDLTGLLVNGAFTLLIFFFLLADADNLAARVSKIIPADSPILAATGQAASSVATFMLILTALNLIIAVLDWLFLLVLGIPHAFLWGVLSFVFGFIPYIGYWVSIFPPLILAFAQNGAMGVLVVILGYWLINGLIGNLVAPRFYGQGLKLSPAISLLAVLFWGAILGPVGSIIGVPLTALIKSILLENYGETRWVAAAIGTGNGEDVP
ncbi:MAG: AI-2E family transporter [Caldilineaceae bacterium]|nr:AI-2E family transporter [Caldilineaceae bacterium]